LLFAAVELFDAPWDVGDNATSPLLEF